MECFVILMGTIDWEEHVFRRLSDIIIGEGKQLSG
jgi:hypothetical protein